MFTHIMVDEYRHQPRAAQAPRQLAHSAEPQHRRLDQAIYSFRRADSGAFLGFGHDFKTPPVTLTENYRSDVRRGGQPHQEQ
jgi:superfamily I DNA/RNA helicase